MDLNPASVDKFLAADKAGKLSTKDRKVITAMRQSVMMTPAEQAADLEDSLSEANMTDLANTIRTAKDPIIRAMLLEEQNRLLNLLSEPAVKEVKVAPKSEESIMDTIGKLLSKLQF